jgi:glucosamine 6-phosphate synthetase-like amidotransferase/phosphosugar isomerase protein
MLLVLKSGGLAVRREALFRCYLDSYDLRQFARRASEVIGNPVVIGNTDHKVLATAGEIPSDRPDIAATVENGYVSQSVEDHLAGSGIHGPLWAPHGYRQQRDCHPHRREDCRRGR